MAAIRIRCVVKHPIVVVFLAGHQQVHVGQAEHAEIARIQQLQRQAVGVLIIGPRRARADALPQAAFGDDDGVDLIFRVHDTGRFIAEFFRQPGEDLTRLDYMAVRRNQCRHNWHSPKSPIR
jgi:hypothetical protein